jgi:alanyl-tRNA synthetase
LIVNKQIKDELDVYAQEVSLASAKRINGLRAVFGEVSFPLEFFGTSTLIIIEVG